MNEIKNNGYTFIYDRHNVIVKNKNATEILHQRGVFGDVEINKYGEAVWVEQVEHGVILHTIVNGKLTKNFAR